MRYLLIVLILMPALVLAWENNERPPIVQNEVFAKMTHDGWKFRSLSIDEQPNKSKWPRCQAAPPNVKFPTTGREGLYQFMPRADGCHAEDVNGGQPVK
jgi:hypothetical protein